jgi:hypothetical protein
MLLMNRAASVLTLDGAIIIDDRGSSGEKTNGASNDDRRYTAGCTAATAEQD